MKQTIIKIIISITISVILCFLMIQHYREQNKVMIMPFDTIRIQSIESFINHNDSTIQNLKINVDSIIEQTQANEAAIQRIHNRRAGANSVISAMSSHELTSALANRYRDSL